MALHVRVLVEPGLLHELAHGVDGEAGVEAGAQHLVEVLSGSGGAQGNDGVPEPPLGFVDLPPLRKARLPRVLVQGVEAVDHEAQAPLGVGEVEADQERLLVIGGLDRLREEALLLRPAAQDAPGQHGVGRIGWEVADEPGRFGIPVDDAADLEANVRGVAEARAAPRLVDRRLLDVGQLLVLRVFRNLVELAGDLPDDRLDVLVDLLPAGLDDVLDTADLLVERAYLDAVVEYRLAARKPRQAAERSLHHGRLLAACRAQADPWIRLEVQQPPVDLDVGWTLADRLDRRPERLAVEHAAVDEPRPGGREL